MNNYRKIISFFDSMRPICARHILEFRSKGPLAKVTDGELTMIELIGRAGRITMSEIAVLVHVTKPTITAHTDRLEAKKLVRRQRSREDRRIVWLVLTSKGNQIYRQSLAAHQFLARTIASSLTANETDLLIKFMDKIQKGVAKHGFPFGSNGS